MSKNLINPNPLSRVRSKSPGMNVPMSGNPEEDNITLLPTQPPIFHNVPDYTIDKNPFSFLYIDTTYKCNMECGFCMTPIRHYEDMKIEVFEELCANLPRPVNMRLVGAEPTLWKHLFEAIHIGTKYGHNIAIVTNGIRLAQKSFVKKLKECIDSCPDPKLVNVSISLNGGFYNDEWYKIIDHDISHREKKVKGFWNCVDAGFKRLCINAIIVKNLNEGVIKEFYDIATSLPDGVVSNIRFRCAAKQGRYVEELYEHEEDQTSYTGVELNDYIKTVIPEANAPLHWIRDGIHPSNGAGKRLNVPSLKCNQCCMMYYIKPKLWVATVEFGSHNSSLCWRRGQFVSSTKTIQPAHHYIDELSRYINTYVPEGMKTYSAHQLKKKMYDNFQDPIISNHPNIKKRKINIDPNWQE
jgi:uncharacterized Fe-S cluster-containing radical SAM superfamily protein